MHIRQPGRPLVVKVRERPLLERRGRRPILRHQSRILHRADPLLIRLHNISLPRPIDGTGKLKNFSLGPLRQLEPVVAKCTKEVEEATLE